MAKFQIGDKVRIIDTFYSNSTPWKGICTITDAGVGYYIVDGLFIFREGQMTLDKHTTFKQILFELYGV